GRAAARGGVGETTDPVERGGGRRGGVQAASANLVLWVVDGAAIESQPLPRPLIQAPPESAAWLVVNKMDLVAEEDRRRIESRFNKEEVVNLVSSTTGAGVDELVNALARFAGCFFTPEPALVTPERHRPHLNQTVLPLQAAQP